MELETCVIPQCKEKVEFLFLRAENRHVVKRALYCKTHGENFQEHYSTRPIVGDGEPQAGEYGVAFDIEVVTYDYRLNKPCQVLLREVGGERRLDLLTGPFEASALRQELEGQSTLRPLTHHVASLILTALGGRLESVSIDKFIKADSIYEAKLHVRHMDSVVLVDVRPSDAITLAVICDVPIFVSKDVEEARKSAESEAL